MILQVPVRGSHGLPNTRQVGMAVGASRYLPKSVSNQSKDGSKEG